MLQAAREVFGTSGSSAPIAAVADRPGVGVGTLYRRYGSKEELLQHLCVLSMRQNLDAVRDGLQATHAWAGLCGYISTCVGFSAGAFAPMASEFEATNEMWQLARSVQKHLKQLTRRAHLAGELRPSATATDIALMIEHFSRGFPASPTRQQLAARRRQLAISLSGLRADADVPRPGPAPRLSAYQARWR